MNTENQTKLSNLILNVFENQLLAEGKYTNFIFSPTKLYERANIKLENSKKCCKQIAKILRQPVISKVHGDWIVSLLPDSNCQISQLSTHKVIFYSTYKSKTSIV